ncbi:MAG TPA: aconitate hydratase AcnA [Thermodesulfobacteriota bacterium]
MFRQPRASVLRPLVAAGVRYDIVSLEVAEGSFPGLSRLPVSLKVLAENLLRHADGVVVTDDDLSALAARADGRDDDHEVAFHPARVLVPDASGVPLVADLAAMRDAAVRLGKAPEAVSPRVPIDVVIDHSVATDVAGRPEALERNLEFEYARNRERYAFLRWAQKSLPGVRVVPPGNGIAHQVNLEFLATVVTDVPLGDGRLAFPDTLVGTDSHTTMINGLGVFGWGVGGIEAASAMLGEPISMLVPRVVGCRLVGAPRPGVTSTDVVLALVERLRGVGVVGAFVEFFGPAFAALRLEERATLANMAPEYGATMGFFPIDDETVRYLRLTGRGDARAALVEAYAKTQGLWHDPDIPRAGFSAVVEFDLSAVEPSLAGPRRPQDRVPLSQVPRRFREAFADPAAGRTAPGGAGRERPVADGDVAIAAITSCTNTSNPSVMLAAGLLARNAVRLGLRPRPWVRTSLAPGSRVVSDYLARAGLVEPLEALGFHVVGYGCMTCAGLSGSLDPAVAAAARDGRVVAAVLSGNRNFEARIHPLVRANFLASPPLVVAYALAGSVLWDPEREPLGVGADGREVFLRDIWPDDDEVERCRRACLGPDLFRTRYATVTDGGPRWEALEAEASPTFPWPAASTYLRRPPFLDDLTLEPAEVADIVGARPLVVLGDSITTDHISPAGAIPEDSPAGRYLIAAGVEPADFNSYVSRRANHEVMARGVFANVRLRNELVPEREGGFTRHWPDGTVMPVHEAAARYAEERVPLVVVAGREYGSGSSRDWAAKGPRLLGVRAVIAESFERIHRSNLVGMGILPLQLDEGVTRRSLRLTGRETFDVVGLGERLAPRAWLDLRIHRPDGTTGTVRVRCRIDTVPELAWFRHGGILQYTTRQLLRGRG